MKRKVRMYKPQFQQGGASNEEFKPHMMYNPETGEGVKAETMEDHLQMKEMGYLHEEEMQQMQQQRKMYGGLVRKELKKKYLAGGTSTAKQNQNIDEFSNMRTGMFKNYMANNASANIAENEAMALYDQQMQAAQMQGGMPMMNYAGQVPNNNTQFTGPVKNQQNLDQMKMYGDMYKKNKQGVSNAFGQIGELAFNTIDNYDPFDITTTTKTKFTKEGKAAYKDYKSGVKDWIKGGQEGDAPISPFARYGGTQPMIPKFNQAGSYLLPTDPPPNGVNTVISDYYRGMTGKWPDYGFAGRPEDFANGYGNDVRWNSSPGLAYDNLVNQTYQATPAVTGRGGPKNTALDGKAWKYKDLGTRNDNVKQNWFDEEWEVSPESWLYSDAANGINSREDYENMVMTKGKDVADEWQQKRNDAYWALPHTDKLQYDENAILRDARGNVVKKDGKSIRGKAGLDYEQGKTPSTTNKDNKTTKTKKTKDVKSTKKVKSTDDPNAADVATDILDEGDGADVAADVAADAPTGNVTFDDVNGGSGSKVNAVTTTDGQGTPGTQGGQGNVYIPQQSFQLGKGRYVDGVPVGPFSGGPMVGYNPNNTYLDYEKIKNKNNMFGNKYKSVRKFSHHFPGQMEYQNVVPGGEEQQVGNPESNNPNNQSGTMDYDGDGVNDLYPVRPTAGPTPNSTTAGIGPDGVPDPALVEAEKQKAAAMQAELMGGYDAFIEKNPNATEEEKRAYVENSRTAMLKKMEGVRPAQSYTGGLTEFLRENDPNDILTNSTYQQGSMMRMDGEGNEYFQYPGTPYVYNVKSEEDAMGNNTGAGIFTAVQDPEILENFRTMNPTRSSESTYYDYDPVKGMEVPRADFVPMQYNEDGSRIDSYDSDSDYGRKEDALAHFQAGDHEGKIKRSDYENDQDYYNALQIPEGALNTEEAAQLGFTKNEGVLKGYYTEDEINEQNLAQDKIDNPRRYLSGEQAMGELTNPDNEGIGMFTKENRKGERKFDYRDMRKEGFKGKEIRKIKKAVKNFDENTEMTGDSEFAMGEVERAYEEGNEGRGARFRKKNKREYGGQSDNGTWQDVVRGFGSAFEIPTGVKEGFSDALGIERIRPERTYQPQELYGQQQDLAGAAQAGAQGALKQKAYGGDYYVYGGNYYVNGGAIPMYVDAGETSVVPPIGGDMVEVEGIDGGGFDYSWNMGPQQPTNPYTQPQQYEVADESLNTPQNPGDMSLNLQGTYKPGAKFADTTQKRKSTPFGDPIKNLSKFVPAIGQAAAAYGNAVNDPDAQARIEQGTTADKAFTADRTWRAGTDAGFSIENKVGLPTPAISAPVQYTGGAGQARYGGQQYQLGGAYTLSDNDVAQILAMGGQIEYLD